MFEHNCINTKGAGKHGFMVYAAFEIHTTSDAVGSIYFQRSNHL